jgi:hypothetical protein
VADTPPDPSALARDALVNFAGCSTQRATALVHALAAVAADEALLVVGGGAPVSNSLVDARVERVRRLVERLAKQAVDEDRARNDGQTPNTDSASLLNAYELAAILRVQPRQAQSLLRTWQARYPEQLRERMETLVTAGTKDVGGTDDAPTWTVEYDDPATLEYAAEQLRRNGLTKGLKVERSAQRIEVPQDSRDRTRQRNALQVLGIE